MEEVDEQIEKIKIRLWREKRKVPAFSSKTQTRETLQSYRHQFDLSENQRIGGEKDPLTKNTGKKLKQIEAFSKIIVPSIIQADQFHFAAKKPCQFHWKEKLRAHPPFSKETLC